MRLKGEASRGLAIRYNGKEQGSVWWLGGRFRVPGPARAQLCSCVSVPHLGFSSPGCVSSEFCGSFLSGFFEGSPATRVGECL